jgi:hypothetical protein
LDAAAMLAFRCSGFLVPTIVVFMSGWLMVKRSMNSQVADVGPFEPLKRVGEAIKSRLTI